MQHPEPVSFKVSGCEVHWQKGFFSDLQEIIYFQQVCFPFGSEAKKPNPKDAFWFSGHLISA
jgi:hypothetical protein